jgi:glycosyltransferase involved in cell wall biosynthesis
LKNSLCHQKINSIDVKNLFQEKFILIVGTIEPRKGHKDVLDAFELLWKENIDYKLVIVGKPGWKTKKLQNRLQNHPLNKNKIFWYKNLNDELLIDMYNNCQGVIVSSYDEGFGLPLIEALGYQKPVLARNISVFQHAKNNIGITYFPQKASASELAKSIYSWLGNIENLDRR